MRVEWRRRKTIPQRRERIDKTHGPMTRLLSKSKPLGDIARQIPQRQKAAQIHKGAKPALREFEDQQPHASFIALDAVSSGRKPLSDRIEIDLGAQLEIADEIVMDRLR